MKFSYITNTEITIDGKKHLIRFENGMTGIGSRDYYLDNKKQFRTAVTQSENLTEGNHFIYTIKWRDTPWDFVDIVIHEDFESELLNEDNAWRKPIKRL